MLLSDFQKKEVINICNCKKLGNVVDLSFDECTGQIHSLIVNDGFHLCNFFNATGDIEICYKSIKQIGSDIILVEIGGR